MTEPNIRILEPGQSMEPFRPAFVTVTAPLQQDDELQVIAICMAGLERLPAGLARQRVVTYLRGRAECATE
jgi:hypothetical protein